MWIFYFIIIFICLFNIIFSESSQRRLLCMVCILLNFVVLLFLLHLEFTGIIVIIVYIGAISVLFLFIVMLVNSLRITNFERNFKLIFFITFIIFYLLYFLIFSNNFLDFFILKDKIFNEIFMNDFSYFYLFNLILTKCSIIYIFNNFGFLENNLVSKIHNLEVEQVGYILWMQYGIFILFCSIILFISILGSILILKGIIIFNLNKKNINLIPININKNYQTIKIKKNKIKLFLKGALTNKPQAFKMRAWEAETSKSINLFDTFGETILVQKVGFSIKRILPLNCEISNFNWITDKVRFFFDVLLYQRISSPEIYYNKFHLNSNWYFLVSFISFCLLTIKQLWFFCIFSILGISKFNIKFNNFNLIIKSIFYFDLNDLIIRSYLLKKIGGGFFKEKEKSNFTIKGLNNYILPKITDLFFKNLKINCLLIVGIDLRFEFPKLNLLLKSFNNKKKINVFLIGIRMVGNFNTKYKNLGFDFKIFLQIVEGRHWINNIFIKLTKLKINNLGNQNYLFLGSRFNEFFEKNIDMKSLKIFCEKYKFLIFILYTRFNELNNKILNFRQLRSNFQSYCMELGISKSSNIIITSSDDDFQEKNIIKNSFHNIFILLNSFITKMKDINCIQLPVFSILERDFSMINIFGKVIKVSKILKGINNNNGFIEQKKVSDFFNILTNFICFKSLSSNLINMIFSKISDIKISKFLDNSIFFKSFFKFKVYIIINNFIINFFQKEDFLKNSVILNVVQNLNLNFSNYYEIK